MSRQLVLGHLLHLQYVTVEVIRILLRLDLGLHLSHLDLLLLDFLEMEVSLTAKVGAEGLTS